MENYAAYNSYPDSGDSSPRSREIEFENPPPWDDQSSQQQQPPSQTTYKAKFMCSYGGKIHPRPHDNQLSYIGGETKILAVDRTTKFSVMISKLAALCGDSDVAFKYQLPGEDLDALISVTNDDDLEHMMHEYDRLFRGSSKAARMRLFLFPVLSSPAASFSSDGGRSDRDRFVEALNSVPTHVPEPAKPPAPGNVDFLFGLEKGVVPPPPPPLKVADLPDMHVPPGHDDRLGGVPVPDPMNIQTHMQRLQIRDHEQQQMYRRNSDENLVAAGSGAGGGGGGYMGGEYYAHKLPDKAPQATMPISMQPSMAGPQGYWQEKQMGGGGGGGYPPGMAVTTGPGHTEQQVYMIPGPTPGTMYPVMRPVTAQPGQGYYMQRMAAPPEVYREQQQQVYNMVPQPQPQQHAPGPMGPMGGMVRPSVTDAGGYAPVAYDSPMGRQVYYTAQGGVMQQAPSPQYHGGGGGGAAGSGEMRPGGGPMGTEVKVATSKASVLSELR